MYSRLCTFLLAGGILANELEIINELGITPEELLNAKKSGSPYKKSGYYGSKNKPFSSLKKTLGDMVVTTEQDNDSMNSEEMDIALSKMITDMRLEKDGDKANGTFIEQPDIQLKQAGAQKKFNDDRDRMTPIPLFGMLLSEDKTRLHFKENPTWCIKPDKVKEAWEHLFYEVDPVDMMPIRVNRNIDRAYIFTNNGCRNKWKNAALKRNFAAKKGIWENQYDYSIISVARHFVNDDHKKQVYLWYQYGHSDDTSYPEVMRGDLAEQSVDQRDQRRTFGKQMFLGTIQSYLINKAAPTEETGEEWVEQANRLFGYGCHCSPSGRGIDNAAVLLKGTYGKPMDKLDEACHLRNQCYHCATDVDSEPGRCDWRKNYKYSISAPNFDFKCEDVLGTCERRLCECDKQYFQSAVDFFDIYDLANHKDTGFDSVEQCPTPVKEELRDANGNKETFGQCCGFNGTRKPYSSLKKCCQNKNPYSPEKQLCCSDGKIGTEARGCRNGATVVEE